MSAFRSMPRKIRTRSPIRGERDGSSNIRWPSWPPTPILFGHWLIDILPRAWMLTTLFGERLDDLQVILPADTPRFAFDLLETLFGLHRERIVLFDAATEEVMLRRAVIPSLLHVDHAFHPAMNLFVSHVLSVVTRDPYKVDRKGGSHLIFVSRQRFRSTTSYGRRIANEADVITLVEDHGFRVICPEDFTFAEQVRIFARARIVIGESGSGLHNTMFSDSDTVVICIRPVNQVQATLAALRRQSVMFFCTEEEHHVDGGIAFSVDIARLGRAISHCKSMVDRVSKSRA